MLHLHLLEMIILQTAFLYYFDELESAHLISLQKEQLKQTMILKHTQGYIAN